MREIKFRAWDEKRRQMHYDAVVLNVNPLKTWGDPKVIFEQFTGITEDNGREIYEGDIVKRYFGWCASDNPYYNHPDNTDNKYFAYPVEFHQKNCGTCQGENVMTWRLGECTNLWNGSQVEVIGNIHENGDLLK